MKERPIPLNSESVRAILDGRKTQTRRVIKSQPELTIEGKLNTSQEIINKFVQHFLFHCPYGQVGDILKIKEPWATENRYNHLKPSKVPQTAEIFYLADGGYSPFKMGKVRSPRFMPLLFSRIPVEITEIRVERVQEITYDDCWAEGINKNLPTERKINKIVTQQVTPKTYFQELWDSLNAKRGYGWEKNPWVFVISFRKVIKEQR